MLNAPLIIRPLKRHQLPLRFFHPEDSSIMLTRLNAKPRIESRRLHQSVSDAHCLAPYPYPLGTFFQLLQNG